MTTLWMLEDLEPFPDVPSVGDVCEPATYWATPTMMDLPAGIVCEIGARVEETTIAGQQERIAHLPDGFQTMIPTYVDVIGETTLTGCLVWDRYLWMDYRSTPTGRALVLERAALYRRRRRPMAGRGWSVLDCDGPTMLISDAPSSATHGIVWNALRVRLQGAG